MNVLLLLPILLPVAAGALLPLFRPAGRKGRQIYVMTFTLLNSLLLAWLLCTFPADGRFTMFRISESLPITLRIDGAGKVFSGLVVFLWPLATCYAFEYMKHEGKETSFFAYYMMTYGVTVGISFAENLVTLYFFYEFLTLVTLPIVMHGMTEERIAAGRKYVMYSIGGAAFAFMGMIVLHVFCGTTDFVLGGVTDGLTLSQEKILRTMYLFAVFGFGVKAAIFPLHGWLPRASVAPTPVTALLHAVAVVNAGVFSIIRVTYYSFGTKLLYGTWVQYVVMATAMFTILFGSCMALKEQHFKRRLAYSTVSNLSYMIFGASLMSEGGMAGALSHMVFHGIMKITLFFVAGAVLYKTGKKFVNDLFGFGKKMPVTFGCFIVAGAALVGIPPTVGFASKWKLLTAAASGGLWLGWAGAGVLLISSLLTAIYIFSLVVKVYFPGPGFDGTSLEGVEDPNLYMKLPMVVLCVAVVALGIVSSPLVSYLEKIAAGAV